MTSEYTFRTATVADTECIADQRYLMFAEMGMDTEMLAKARVHYVPWLVERLSNGIYTGTLVESDAIVIAGAGIWVGMGAPLPTLHSSDHRRASIVNVYTHPDHRRRGLARQLVSRLIDFAREENYPIITLHASDAGRALYESMGFRNTNELRLQL